VLLPIIASIVGLYVVLGLAMPVLPLHVHQRLGFGPFVVGLVSGSQFAAAIFSRMWAGRHADHRGAKHALVRGLLVSSASGFVYLLSFAFASQPETSVCFLILGRAVLGAGESFVITGALSLGMALLAPGSTGKVMSWIGTALYAGFAVGAPLGASLYAGLGFVSVALATAVIPLCGLPLLAFARPAAIPQRKPATRASQVVRAIWVPGLGVALSGVGFGAISTFIVLVYAARAWTPAWLPFTALSIAFIGGRALFGHLPDRIGGAKVALACIFIEATGQALIWWAESPLLALAGVTLTGLGYSLVYPGFGVEAIRRTPPESRGLAMGSYTAFLDLSLGLTGPALGLVAGRAGLNAVFLASTVIVSCAMLVALRLIFMPLDPQKPVAAGNANGDIHSDDVATMETF
jgi:MFS family permease